MALKALLLRRKIDEAEKSLAALREQDAGFEAREAELETAIGEAQSGEERSAVEEMVNTFEAEKNAHSEARAAREAELEQLRADLAREEETQRAAAKAAAPKEGPNAGRKDGGTATMEIRDSFFGLAAAERDALFAREEVRTWVRSMRAILKRDAGDVSNAQVLIPQVMLPFFRQVAEESSKMLRHVNLQRVPGEGRMIIDGGFPEAIWTEMCGSINEVSIGFYDISIAGWKVSAFVKVCNALLEDSDVALASEIISKLGRGVGYALDKAILFGDGTRMPLGIVTRLAQTAKPSGYPDTARSWADLHTRNIISITSANSTGIALYKNMVLAGGKMRNKFSRGSKWWAMNEDTLSTFLVEGMEINASGVIVSTMGDTMPIIGGKVETLDFIPDNVVIGGYDGLYLLAERAGQRFAQTEHRFFTEDQTAFRVTARYDGVPVIPEGFIAVGIKGASVNPAAVTFPPDAANAVEAETEDSSDPG